MKRGLTAFLAVALALVLTASATAGTVIGVNFCDGWDKPQLEGKTADGFDNWTDSWPLEDWGDASSGSDLVLHGSNDLVTVSWAASNTWAGGLEDTSEQQLYRVYLDDGGDGPRITFDGLGDWLAAIGAPGYTVRIYHSSDNASGFTPTSLYDADDDSLLATVQAALTWDTDGGLRGYVDSGVLSADSLLVAAGARDDSVRGAIAAVKITAVPEPMTMALLGLGSLALRRKRK